MAYGCPKCYGEKMMTILLEQREDGVFACPRNPNHKFTLNSDGMPVSKKD
ncbi:MAG: hypothetical protein AABW72_03855 [archaeon]